MNARFSIPILACCLLLLVLPSCDSLTDSGVSSGPGVPSGLGVPSEPEVTSDFFPAMAVGSTISWDYKYQYIAGVSTLVEGLIGTMTWTITSVYDSSGTRVMTMRQEFNGLLDKHRSDTPYIRDTVWIQSDTTMGSISEDPNHTVIVTTWATGRDATYGGRVMIFPRYPSGVQGDVLDVTTTGDGRVYGTNVKAQRSLGLIYYYSWTGINQTKYRTTMTRR